MNYINIDKPIFIFILVLSVLFAHTVLTKYPPEEAIPSVDVMEYEPIDIYEDNTINTTTDNVSVHEALSVTRYTK